MLEHIQRKFFGEIAGIQKTVPEVHVPEALPFVPYAFQTNMPRAAVRSHPVLSNLHQFLVNETAIVCFLQSESFLFFVLNLYFVFIF